MSSPDPFPSPSSTSPRGVFSLASFEPRHPHDETVRQLLAAAPRSLDAGEVSAAIKAFNEHWVDSVADLRLLQQDGMLRDIGLPPRLCAWVEEELLQVVATGLMHAPWPATDAMSVASSPFPPTPLMFRYQSDMDTNGLLYYLGTASLTAPYVNPVQRGLVRVTCNGLMKDSLPIEHVVGRATVRCLTSADVSAWICVELLGAFLQPAAYTLRHYSSWDTECMRSWKLEASRDGKLFTTLSTHVNDPALQGAGSTHTWPIQLDQSRHAAASSPLHHFYRFFRIALTGPNSNNHLYLACSGLELYGDALTVEQYNAAAGAAVSLAPAPAASSAPASLSMNGFHSTFPSIEDVEMKSAVLSPSAQPFHPSPSSLPSSSLSSSSSSSSPDRFVYQYDLDHHGLIYAIATDRHSHPWRNPADSRRVAVTASSLLEDSAPLSAVVGLDVVRCVTQPRPHSWMALDLLDKTLLLTAYTLRHYASWDIEALRTWRLEGSMTGDDWALLREHVNDESLNAKGKAATWTIDVSTPAGSRAYRMFRLLQTGENSNKHHYLACSGWELYGQLFAADGHSPYVWKSSPLLSAAAPEFHPLADGTSSVVLSHTSDFDGGGVFHHIATAGGERGWVNPHTAGLLMVTASSLADDSVGVEAVVGLEVVRCVTQNVPMSWVQVDLLDRRLCPTAYTLRHYSSWDTECLRSWKLEGSCGEGDSWELLSEHVHDEQLNGKGSSHTWPLICTAFYSTFRITQTAENSNKHHYLALSGWEMYGTLSTHTASQQQQQQRDSNGGHMPMELTAEAAASLQANEPALDSSSSTSFSPAFPPIDSVAPFPPPDSFAASHGLTVAVPSSASPSTIIRTLPPEAATQATGATTPSASFSPLPFAFASPSPVNPSPSPTLGPLSYSWEATQRGPHLSVLPTLPSVVRNLGSNDKWQMARSLHSFSTGSVSIGIRVVNDTPTSNTWRFIVGVIPHTLDCAGPKQWVGTGGSWGYIAGTGGKCHQAATSREYGEKYGHGDVIGLVMDFDRRSLTFYKNGVSQGEACDTLVGPVYVAASMTATDSGVALVPFAVDGKAEAADGSVADQQPLMGVGTAKEPAMAQTTLVHSASTPFAATLNPTATLPSAQPHPSHPAFLRSNTLPAPLHTSPLRHSTGWDPDNKSPNVMLDPNSPSILRNAGSNDKWQSARSLHCFTRSRSPHHSFTVTVLASPKTPNSWRMIVGVVPASFTCTGSKQWVGAGGSWGYIGGTGGKCYNEPKTKPYGDVWGEVGDVVQVRLDLDKGTVEFVKNGVSQGVAFDGVQGPLYAAFSATATGASVRLGIE